MKIPHFQKKILLPLLIYLYLFLPFVLFLVGWTKPFVSIPVLIILTVCFYSMVKTFPELWLPKFSKDVFFKTVCILFIIFVWVWLSGIGKLVFQNEDQSWRNGWFDLLVLEEWPLVYFSPTIENNMEAIVIVYYFGFWLPAAIIGKLFGLTAGYITQVIWAVTGIFLFYYLIIAKYIRKIVFWPLVVLIFFSGLDILGIYLLGNNYYAYSEIGHLEWWASPFQFSSMTTQLFWVFNQAVPAWLVTMILLIQKKNRHIAVIVALAMITSTLPFFGLIVLAICVVVKNYVANKNSDNNQLKDSLLDIFTFENIAGGGLIGIISFLFLKNNGASSQINSLNLQSLKGTVFLWFLFYMIEAGIYFIAVWKYQKHNYLLYYSLLWLAICPWIEVGTNSDFCMRASIPALIIVLLLVIDTINKSRIAGDFKTLVVMLVILAIGSYTPIKEITRTTANTVFNMRNNQPIERDSKFPWEPFHP
jgi:hypothetical protein